MREYDARNIKESSDWIGCTLPFGLVLHREILDARYRLTTAMTVKHVELPRKLK